MASVKTANSEFRARSSTQADNTFRQVPNILGVSETIEALGRYEWTVVQSMLWHQHGHGKTRPFQAIVGKPYDVLRVRPWHAMITLSLFTINSPYVEDLMISAPILHQFKSTSTSSQPHLSPGYLWSPQQVQPLQNQIELISLHHI
jgi:hypothetical protein